MAIGSTRHYLLNLAENRLEDRYHSLNISASFQKHKTLEFRLHNGTADAQKVLSWSIFLLKLVDAVQRGLKHSDITDVTFETIMNAIGMDESATSVIKSARDFLYRRYIYWKEDARENPQHIPQVAPVNIENFYLEQQIRRLEELERRRAGIMHSYQNRWRWRLLGTNPDLPSNAIHNLVSRRLNGRIIEMANFEQLDEDGMTWAVPSRSDPAIRHTVTLNSDNTLNCECRGFRRYGYCYHTINLARFLVTRQELAEVTREITREITSLRESLGEVQ